MISSLPTIAKAAEQIRVGEISPLDLVEFCLAQIEQYEDPIQAWVWVDVEGARETAKQQAKLLAEGTDPGPLAGMPIGIKDIIDVAGWPTKAGSPLRADHRATADATLVRSLRDAGAILLGKTVTTQFASFDPPPTRNPWHRNRTPGGSSSGSTAAVALEMCMAAIGSQTGGSIIRPASYCGVAGLKPTFGQVSLEGVVPLSQDLDHPGPIARSVGDLQAVHAAICRPVSVSQGSQVVVPQKSQAGDTFGPQPIGPFAIQNLGDEPPPRVHVIETYFMEQASAEVKSITRVALAKIQDAWSAEHSLLLPSSFDEVHANHYRLMAYGAAEYHRQDFTAHRAEYAPNIATLIEDGLATTREQYLAAIAHQQRFQGDMDALLGEGEIAAMPSTPTTAPACDTTGDPKFNSPWSYAGLPAITIPCGVAADGLPCGLQLVGSRNSETRLMQAAAWCEARLQFRQRPSLLDE